MSLVCAGCGAQVAPGAPRCPECPSTEFTEAEMPKITGAGVVSYEDGREPDGYAPPEDEPEATAAEPEPETAAGEPVAHVPPRLPPRRPPAGT